MPENPYEPPRSVPEHSEEPERRGKLVCVARYFDAATAHIARSVLDSEGIFACLDAETTNTMLPYVGTAFGGVKLLVEEDQVDKARTLLTAHDAEDFVGDVADQPSEVADDDGDDEDDPPELREREDHIRRAWIAAIFGLLLCPPLLNLYSFYLLLKHGLLIDDPQWPTDWRINAALVVNLLVFAVPALVLFNLFG